MKVAYNTLGDAERIAALNSGQIIKGGDRPMRVAGATLSPVERELQAATLARNYHAMFTKNGVPYDWPANAPLGKYSFIDDPDGSRRYVPFTAADIENFARSPFAKSEGKYKCPDKRRRELIKRRVKAATQHASKFPPTDPRHVRHLFPGRPFCTKPHDDLLKKVAVAAVVVTGGVMLGPAIMGAVKGAAGSVVAAGGKIAGALAKAVPLASQVINSKGTIDAVQRGEMPGPPISIGDGSLTDYAAIVGQQLLERDMARAASDAEKQQLAWLIEQQRLAMAQGEPLHLPIVHSGLAPELTAAGKERADAATSQGNLLKLLAVGLPLAFILVRGS